MRRIWTAVAIVPIIAVRGTACAAPAGPPVDRFAQTWSATPTDRFAPRDGAIPTHEATTRVGDAPGGVLDDALASASDAAFRRDLAIDEIASEWGSVRRAALEDLRDAQRRYAEAAGGDTDARGVRFVALLRQVVDGSGRSVGQDEREADATLGAVYDRVIRDAPDEALPAIQASEKAWTAYRDAFDRFARAIDRPDAVRTVHDQLARRHAEELQAISAR